MTFTQILAAVWLIWGLLIFHSARLEVRAARQAGRRVDIEIDVRPWLLLGVVLAVAVLL